MGIVLTAVDETLANAWATFCGDAPGVRVHRGSILELRCDAVVSPANSFGFMDGGIDLAYRQRFGRQVQERVQGAIVERRYGELLVGDALIVETGDPDLPFLIAAPTMRVPMMVRDTPNAYLAARAVFLLIKHGRFDDGTPVASRVASVALPGLATGIGRMGPATCAHQVRRAIDDVLGDGYHLPRTWAEASERHQLLYTDRLRRLQHDGG